MTREPDRFDAILADWDKHFNHPASNRSIFDKADLLKYLRAAESSALERAAQEADSAVGFGTRGAALRDRIRALASPAAALAAEVKVNACQADLRTDKDRECFDDIVQAATRVLHSEPVTPAPLLPRVLRALETWGFAALAAELRAYIAEREPAEKHIAELEGLVAEANRQLAALAARTAKVKGEGT